MAVRAATAPRGRDGPATRRAILTAARRRFVLDGYDGASLRDIATDVGVDAALVCRAFGGKEGLFAEALKCSPDMASYFHGSPETVALRLARQVVLEPNDQENLATFMMILRSIASPQAADTIRRHNRTEFYRHIEAWLGGGPDAALRARLVAGVITGFATCRGVDATFGLDAPARDALCERVADMLLQAVS